MASSNTTKAKRTPKKAITAANMDFEALLSNMDFEQVQQAKQRLLWAMQGFELATFEGERKALVVLDIPVSLVPSRNETIRQAKRGWQVAGKSTSNRKQTACMLVTQYLNENSIETRPYLTQSLIIRFTVGTKYDIDNHDTKAVQDALQKVGLVRNDSQFKELIYKQDKSVNETGIIKLEIYEID